MQRYFVDKLNNIITGDDHNHITKVMRMNIDDNIIVCCNNKCFTSRITNITNKEVHYVTFLEHEKINYPQITLIQGMPKYFKVDSLIKYATTFGASQIIFTQMNRSTTKVNNINSKLNRLNKIAKEASELAHKQNITKVKISNSIKDIDFSLYDISLVADENIKDDENKLKNFNITKDLKIALIIGPEGGISDEERIYLEAQNTVFVSLGKYVLPTEIANLYLLAVISAKYNNFFDK